MSEKKVFLFAGEKSGDNHGSCLLAALSQQSQAYSYIGVGGPQMRSNDFECVMEMEKFETMGFTDVIRSLPKTYRNFLHVRDSIIEHGAAAVVLIDYPGFNLRLAHALRQKGYQGKIVQYVSPAVWAWGKKRVLSMEKSLDLLLTIYPFEKACFSNTSLNVHYVGHPSKEKIQNHHYREEWKQLLGIKTDPIIAIFPGSRKSEIQNNLPIQLEAARRLKTKDPALCFVVSCAHAQIMPAMHQILQERAFKLNQDIFLVPQTYTYEMMRDSTAAIAKSGTVTLELALHKCPSVVIYKVGFLNRMIVKYLIRPQVNHFCIANILAQKEVFPELIKDGLTAANIAHRVEELSSDGERRQACLRGCEEIARMLDQGAASKQAAQAILELI